MKLLTQTQVKDLKSQEVERDILRAKEMDEVTTKSRLALSKAEADFSKSLAEKNRKWAQEEEEHMKAVKERESEIRVLEERKKQALIPIDMYKKEAEMKMKEADARFDRLEKAEIYNAEILNKLEDRLDEVGDREIAVKAQEEKLRMRKEGLDRQEEMRKQGNERLTLDLYNFYKAKEQAEKEIQDKKDSLFMMERSILAKENMLNDKEKDLSEWAKRLADERDTLERAMKRISS